MARPKLLGIDYAAKAAPVREGWRRLAKEGTDDRRHREKAKLKSLTTFEARGRTNPLTAGDPIAKDRWPGDLVRDYGADIPNLFRFELADRWRGYYSIIGEPGGARIWVLYLWDHATYSKQSGYSKKWGIPSGLKRSGRIMTGTDGAFCPLTGSGSSTSPA